MKAKSKSKANSKAKTSVAKTSKKDSQDIVDLILRDHKPIKELILVLKDSEVAIGKKRSSFHEFHQLLSNHAKAEEQTLYVEMKNSDDLRIESFEGDIEHKLADRLMSEVNEIKNDNDMFTAKVKVLAELVEHHIAEEENEVLKQVRKEFDAELRSEIGEDYSKLLHQLAGEPNSKTSNFEKSSEQSQAL